MDVNFRSSQVIYDSSAWSCNLRLGALYAKHGIFNVCCIERWIECSSDYEWKYNSGALVVVGY